MHYQYQISCPTDNLPPESKPPQRADESQLFEAYSCLLFESWQRFNARLTPLKPLRCGVMLAFDTDLPPLDVDARVRLLVSRRNARLHGVSLVARCDRSPGPRTVAAR